MPFLVSDLGTGVVEESAPSLIGEHLTPAAEFTAALPMDHLHGAGDTARTDTAMPARQPAEPDAPAHPFLTSGTGDGAGREPVAPLRLTGGTTGSTSSAARDAGQDGPDPRPGVALSRMLGDLTRLVGTAAMPAEPVGFETGSATSSARVSDLTPVTPYHGVAAVCTTPFRASAAAHLTGLRLGPEPERAARSAPATEPPLLAEARTGVPGQLSGHGHDGGRVPAHRPGRCRGAPAGRRGSDRFTCSMVPTA